MCPEQEPHFREMAERYAQMLLDEMGGGLLDEPQDELLRGTAEIIAEAMNAAQEMPQPKHTRDL